MSRRLLRPATLLTLLLALGLAACQPQTLKDKSGSANEAGTTAQTPPPPPTPRVFAGAELTLIDAQQRPLDCRGIAKSGDRVLVERIADGQRFVIEFARLSPESRDLVAQYPNERDEELQAFVDERDYHAAKTSVKVEMISATWCSWCTKTKDFFAREKIRYDAYDHESYGGKQRRDEWGSTSLPTVKIGRVVIRGYDEEEFRRTLLSEYRKTAGGA